MNKTRSLRDLLNTIKDKASETKAALLSNPNAQSLNLTILKSTSHDPSSPPPPKHISTLLSFGHGSRGTASAVISSLMIRLHRTSNSSVSLKCLIIIHNLINRGSFILQDQLSVFPTFGGRNYLNLSNFRDSSSPTAWILSSWIRWYANYIEHLLCTSRTLGFFLSSSSSTLDKYRRGEAISSLANKDLLKEIDSLINLVQEICKVPDSFHLEGNRLVDEVMKLVRGDYILIMNEISPRFEEFKFKERLSCLTFGDSVELVCELKSFEDCRDRLTMLFGNNNIGEIIWDLVSEVKDMIGMDNTNDGYGITATMRWKGGRWKLSESARFDDRVSRDDPVRFSSGRFIFGNKFEFSILE